MIHRLKFSIDIPTEKDKIWQALWGDESYRSWAGVFYEGSYAISNQWEEGSTVLFLAPDKSGIYSIIGTHVPNEIMAFKHIGNVVNGEEQALDEESKKWTGTKEIYPLIKKANSNTLKVEIDILGEHLDFMKSKLPKALEKIKANCS